MKHLTSPTVVYNRFFATVAVSRHTDGTLYMRFAIGTDEFLSRKAARSTSWETPVKTLDDVVDKLVVWTSTSRDQVLSDFDFVFRELRRRVPEFA